MELMAGEVVVYGVVVEVKMGGGEISGRERPARAPAEAHLGWKQGWRFKPPSGAGCHLVRFPNPLRESGGDSV